MKSVRLVSALILVATAILCSGCVIRTYREGTTTYQSIAIFAGTSVAPFSLEAGKPGDPSYRKLDSKGVTSDSTAAIDAAVTAAVRAAKPL